MNLENMIQKTIGSRESRELRNHADYVSRYTTALCSKYSCWFQHMHMHTHTHTHTHITYTHTTTTTTQDTHKDTQHSTHTYTHNIHTHTTTTQDTHKDTQHSTHTHTRSIIWYHCKALGQGCSSFSWAWSLASCWCRSTPLCGNTRNFSPSVSLKADFRTAHACNHMHQHLWTCEKSQALQ